MTMLSPATTPPAPAAVPDVAVFRLTVRQYHEMIRNGTLTESDPVELLEGWLTPKVSKNPPHRAATLRTGKALERVVPSGWYVDRQEPITTADSEPEPDVYVIRGDTLDYLDRHPGPADCALVVEVADSTLSDDRGIKQRVYSRAGVPVYWIVAVRQRFVEVYTNPSGPMAEPAYRVLKRYADGDAVPVVVDGRVVGTVAVADLLP